MRTLVLAMLIGFVAYLFFFKLNKWKPGSGIKFRKMYAEEESNITALEDDIVPVVESSVEFD